LDKSYNDEIGIYRIGWKIDNPDPVFLLHSLNSLRMIDFEEEEKQLLEQAKMNLDDKETALDYLYQLEEKIMERATIIPLYYTTKKDVN
ncbi:MAG: hypothetical protein ACOCQS_02725, partial [Bacillota bacterium]